MSDILSMIKAREVEHRALKNGPDLVRAEFSRVVEACHRAFEREYLTLSRRQLKGLGGKSIPFPALSDCLKPNGVEIDLGENHGIYLKAVAVEDGVIVTPTMKLPEPEDRPGPAAFGAAVTSFNGVDLQLARQGVRRQIDLNAQSADARPSPSVREAVMSAFFQAIARSIDFEAEASEPSVPDPDLAVPGVTFHFKGRPKTMDCSVQAAWATPSSNAEGALAQEMLEMMALQLYKSGELFNADTGRFNSRVAQAIEDATLLTYQVTERYIDRSIGVVQAVRDRG